MDRFATLRWRLALWMSAGVIGALLLALGSGYWVVRERTLQRVGQDLLSRQQVIARGIGEIFAGVERRSRELAAQIERARPTPAQLTELMASRVLNDSETASMGVLLEPENPLLAGQRVAIIVTYGSTGISVIDFTVTGYEYWTKDWYRRTLDQRSGWWSDPYFNDAAGGQDTATYDYPLIDAEGRAFGMIGVSITLDRVAEIADSLGLQRDGDGSRYLLADRLGKLVMTSETALERAYTLAQAADKSSSPAFDWVAATRPGDPPKLARLDDPEHGGESLAFASVPVVDWRVATVVTDAHLLASLHATVARIAGVILLLALAVVGLLYFLAGRLTKPLSQLADAAERLANGDIAPALASPDPGDGLGDIAAALERARLTLQSQGERAALADRAIEQTRHTLDLAATLQRGLLPDDRVLFGPHMQCESAARVLPSRAVAGDFHGVVSPRPGLGLYYLVDVSGAGASAIAVMARLGAQLPLVARQGGELDDVLARLAVLWQDSECLGTVAVLLLRVDLAAGDLHVASAGAPGPILRRADGSQSVIELVAQPPLGGGRGWSVWRGQVMPGDRVLAVSNGVLQQLAGDTGVANERLQVLIEELAERRSGELPAALIDRLRRGLGDEPPADDLAVLQLALQHRD